VDVAVSFFGSLRKGRKQSKTSGADVDERGRKAQQIVDQILEAELNGTKLLVVISGRQGTGKSALALSVLMRYAELKLQAESASQSAVVSSGFPSNLGDCGTLLLQGQTRDRFLAAMPADLGLKVESTDSKATKWKAPIVILDEAHLAPPIVRSVGAQNHSPASRYGKNSLSATARLELVRTLATIRKSGVGDPGDGKSDLLVGAAGDAAGVCLIVVRDERQIRESLAMTNEEFAESVGAVIKSDCTWTASSREVACQGSKDPQWVGPENVSLTRQMRNSAAWNDFLHDFLDVGIINLEELREKYGRCFREDEVGRMHFTDAMGDGSEFTAVVFKDGKTFVNWSIDQQEGSGQVKTEPESDLTTKPIDGGFRVFATFSWEDFTERRLVEPGWSYRLQWAASDEESRANLGKRKRRLKVWPIQDEYDFRVDGVGYIKSGQNQDFAGVGVLIDSTLRWEPEPNNPSCGRWALDHSRWEFAGRGNKQGLDQSEETTLINQALNEARTLLGRGRQVCGVLLMDPEARRALRACGFDFEAGAR